MAPLFCAKMEPFFPRDAVNFRFHPIFGSGGGRWLGSLPCSGERLPLLHRTRHKPDSFSAPDFHRFRTRRFFRRRPAAQTMILLENAINGGSPHPFHSPTLFGRDTCKLAVSQSFFTPRLFFPSFSPTPLTCLPPNPVSPSPGCINDVQGLHALCSENGPFFQHTLGDRELEIPFFFPTRSATLSLTLRSTEGTKFVCSGKRG